MTDILAHAQRFVRQKRHHDQAMHNLEKRQGRTTSVTVTRVRATDDDEEVTVTRVRQTTRPTVVDDEEDESTTTARAARPTQARAPTTTTAAPAPATTSSRLPTSAAIVPIASNPIIAPVPAPAPITSTVVALPSGTLGQANGANPTTSKGGLSQGATIGVGVGAGIIGLILLGLIGTTIYRRRKNKANWKGDYSWSSREKDDLYGPSPSRNVMSDASFGNAAPASSFRPLSGEESRKMLLGGAATHNTTSFSEAMFSQPKSPSYNNVPRASFMTGPQGPPPSVGALYGQPVPSAAGASPFDDSQQYQGKLFVVRRTFEPSLADELIIYPGDRIEIITCYDDGWCLGINIDSAKPGQEPQKGVFPRDCVEEIGGPSQDTPLSSGPSSLQRAPTLPPMPFEGGPPAISVSSPGTVGKSQQHQQQYSEGSHILSRFPETPAHRESLAASPRVKRTSSLIAGKDAELYRALGDAIDGNGSRRL